MKTLKVIPLVFLHLFIGVTSVSAQSILYGEWQLGALSQYCNQNPNEIVCQNSDCIDNPEGPGCIPPDYKVCEFGDSTPTCSAPVCLTDTPAEGTLSASPLPPDPDSNHVQISYTNLNAEIYYVKVTNPAEIVQYSIDYGVENPLVATLNPIPNINSPLVAVAQWVKWCNGAAFLSPKAYSNIFTMAGGVPEDSIPPQINVVPTSEQISIGTTYTLIHAITGVTATDNVDGTLTDSIVVSGANFPLNTAAPATYTIMYNVSDAAGNAAAQKTRTVEVVALAMPEIPQLILPIPNEVGTNPNTTFVWTDVETGATGDLRYNFRIRQGEEGDTVPTSCAIIGSQSTDFVQSNIDTNVFDPGFFDLDYNKKYFWCVEVIRDGNVLLASSLATFSTQAFQIPTSTIEVIPETSSGPSGQMNALVAGSGGESGSFAHIFEVLTDGTKKEVVKTLIAFDGTFSANVDVTLSFAGAGLRTYQARIERPGNPSTFGAFSESATYHYDPSLAINAPNIEYEDNGVTTGALKWAPVSSATHYKVYRRVGLEICTPSDTTTCYQNKHFKLIADVSADPMGGYIHYTDSNVPALPANAYACSVDQNPCPPGQSVPMGYSYFVTAHTENGQESVRSNSLSFQDLAKPKRSAGETVQYVALPGGHEVAVYYCGVQNQLNVDTSADLLAQVQGGIRNLGESCDNFNFEAATQYIPFKFDALKVVNPFPEAPQNCVLAGVVGNLEANTAYCFKSCLRDISTASDPLGNQEANCVADSGNTDPDTIPPDFSGISDVVANSGTSIAVKFFPAFQGPNSGEVITYEIRYQKIPVGDVPALSTTGEAVVINGADLVQGEAAWHIVEGLETGENYCLWMISRDDANNISPATIPYLCTSTYDIKPHAVNFVIADTNPTKPYELPILFQVTDLESQQSGHKIALTKFRFKLPGQDFVEVSPIYLTSNISFQNIPSGISETDAPFVTIFFNTLPFFQLGQKDIVLEITLKDTNGYETVNYSSTHDIFQGTSQSSKWHLSGLSGCSLQTDESGGERGGLGAGWLLLVGACFGALIICRRRNSLTRERE